MRKETILIGTRQELEEHFKFVLTGRFPEFGDVKKRMPGEADEKIIPILICQIANSQCD